MNELTIGQVWALLLAGAGAIVLLTNCGKALAEILRAAKAPNVRQDERIDALAAGQEDLKKKLSQDDKRLKSLEEGNRVTQRAILALLGHSIDGNNDDQMRKARADLQNHLIEK